MLGKYTKLFWFLKFETFFQVVFFLALKALRQIPLDASEETE